MNVAARYAEAMNAQEKLRVLRVLFLDLDGTVRKGFDELGRFVNGPKDVEVFPEAVTAMQKYKADGWLICGISNQGGLALGHMSYEDCCAAMLETQRQCGGLFDKISFCRHHPEAKDPIMAECWCRKPRIGQIIEVAQDLARMHGGIVPPSSCLFVGDRPEDQQCAANAGIRFIWAKDWRATGGSYATLSR